MMKIFNNSFDRTAPSKKYLLSLLTFSIALAIMVGCGGAKVGKKKDDFFTSGSREADQRASQRMAKDEQLTGSGEGMGEKGVKKAVPASIDNGRTNSLGTNR